MLISDKQTTTLLSPFNLGENEINRHNGSNVREKPHAC